ncbi:protein O-mannosyl-transferase family [candidate division KSB1 bacterium]
MLKGIKAQFNEDREIVIFGLITFLTALLVYFKTMAPTVSFWDCGEFIACSYILGIPHPPGAPFYLLLGRVFSLLPLFSDISARIGIISVISTAFTILFTYLIIIQLIRGFQGYPQRRLDRLLMYGAASIGSLCFAFSDTLWFNAVEAEVYALSMFITALTLWLALKWFETRTELRSIRYLLFIFYLFGIATGVHLLNQLLIPSIVLLILFYEWRLLLKWRLWVLVPLITLVGISTYFMIFIRSGMAPSINENDPSTISNFWYYFSRKQYGEQSLFLSMFDRQAPLFDYQIKFMHLRYFAWNFIGKGTTLADTTRGFIAETFSGRGLMWMPFLAGVTGFAYHFKKDWRKALAILALFITAGIGIVIYLNQPAPQPRERDYVYIGSFFAFALWIGIGVFAVLTFVRKVMERGSLQYAGIALAAALMLYICPVRQYQFNFDSHNRNANYAPWDYAYNMLVGCEPNAILFTNGDNDTFPIWYLQEVEGIRKDIKIVNLSLLNTNWYILQLKNYEPRIDFGLTDDQIMDLGFTRWQTSEVRINVPIKAFEDHYNEYNEQVPDGVRENPQISFTVEPTLTIQDIDVLKLQDRMVLQIVGTNLGIRPVYFAITVDPAFFVGLRKFFRLEGLNWKVTPVENPALHEETLHSNITDLYRYRGIDNPEVHFDFGTMRLLNNYRNAFMMLAQHYNNTGQRDKIGQILDFLLAVVPDYRSNFRDQVFTENIGKLYWLGGREEEFRASIQEMLAWEPEISEEKQFEYANYYINLFQDYDNAEPVLRKLYDKDNNNGRYLSRLLVVYESQKSWTKGVELLEDWVQRQPQDEPAQQKLSQLRDSLAAQEDIK